ncbi:hypothetical protein NKH98_01130 [Mesorhizobium sp. M0833]|uniref:hypothetical protein n=1 Tax=Mesorhizobium sp. M0833 TaxID=2957009 RepID=UPI0033359530
MDKKINLSQVFAGQTVGIKQGEDHIWLVSFVDMIWAISTMRHVGSNHPKNPFGPKGYLCLWYKP